MSSEAVPASSRAAERRGLRGLLAQLVSPAQFAALRSMSRLVTRAELQAPLALDLKLRGWRRGFRASSVALYGIEQVESGLYVSDYERIFRGPGINPIPALFRHKLLLRHLLAERGFAQPETVAMISRGGGILADPLGEPHALSAEALVRTLLAGEGRYIWKREDGSRGSGIALLEVVDGALHSRRGSTTRPFRLPAVVRLTHLIERVVDQHPFWAALSGGTGANTMRILTMWTPGEPAPFIARAVQRIGTAATLPTDNWSGGGLCALVDLETGRLGPGRVNPFKSGKPDRPYREHPESGAQIEGAVLPGWPAIAEAAVAAARALPYAPYIGWDIAVDRTGRAVIIEGNKNTDVDLLQVHGGLLADPAVRRFYEAYGVVD